MYGNGYSMAIVLDHRSTATSLTGNSWKNPGTLMPRLYKKTHQILEHLKISAHFCYGHFGMKSVPDTGLVTELSFFTGRWAVCLWGWAEFFGVVKGGPVVFSGSKRGTRIFWGSPRGGTRIFSQDRVATKFDRQNSRIIQGCFKDLFMIFKDVKTLRKCRVAAPIRAIGA